MKFKACLYFCSCMLLLGIKPIAAQDAQFSQYLNSGIYLNPAVSSSYQTFSIGANYRSQWNSIVAPYSTFQISAIKPVFQQNRYKNKIGAVALSFYNDQTADGILKEMGGMLNGSYNLRITHLNSVFFGLQVGFIQKSLSYDQLTWGNQYTPSGFDPNKDPEVATKKMTTIYPDVSAGIVYSFNPEKDYGKHGANYSSRLGVSVYHINNPNESFFKESHPSRLPLLYKVHGDIEIYTGNSFYIIPAFLFQAQKRITQLNAGMHLSYHLKQNGKEVIKPTQLMAGLWYRYKDSFIFLAGFTSHYYSLTFSYDLNTTFFREYSYGTGAYEISLRLIAKKEKGNSSKYYYRRN